MQRIKRQSQLYLEQADPIISTWPDNSALFSTILTKDSGLDWILNYFVQMKGTVIAIQNDNSFEDQFENEHKNKSGKKKLNSTRPLLSFLPERDPIAIGNMWELCPFINTFDLNREIINTMYENFSDFAIDLINNHYYIWTTLHQKDIRGGNDIHNCYIIGYDLKKKTITIKDHINHGKYAPMELSFDKFNLAHKMFIEHTDAWFKRSGKILYKTAYMVKTNHYTYSFNIKLMIALIIDYLSSTDSMGFVSKFRSFDEIYFWGKVKKKVYGVACYDLLQHYLSDLIQNETIPDSRIFTFLVDHKKLMHLRVEYLYKNNYISKSPELVESFRQIKEQTITVLNLFLKYQINSDNTILVQIKGMLNKIKHSEITGLKKIITLLIHS